MSRTGSVWVRPDPLLAMESKSVALPTGRRLAPREDVTYLITAGHTGLPETDLRQFQQEESAALSAYQ
jgi:hypothetical protein